MFELALEVSIGRLAAESSLQLQILTLPPTTPSPATPLAERVEIKRRAAANGAPRTDLAKGKGEITASVEALQYKQCGDAYPDHAAEAEGQRVREVVEGKRQVGLGDHFVHDEVSCRLGVGFGLRAGNARVQMLGIAEGKAVESPPSSSGSSPAPANPAV